MILSEAKIKKIKEIIEKNYKTLEIGALNAKMGSILELVYNHNYLNSVESKNVPTDIKGMAAQQKALIDILPKTPVTKSAITGLNGNLLELIEKQKTNTTTNFVGLIQKANSEGRNAAIQNLVEPGALSEKVESLTKAKLKQELRDTTGDAARSWERVAITEISNAQGLGSLDRISDENRGENFNEIYVYRISIKDAALCLPEEVKVLLQNNKLKVLKDLKRGDILRSPRKCSKLNISKYPNKVVSLMKKEAEVFEYEFTCGTKITCTEDHSILIRYKSNTNREGTKVVFMPVNLLENSLIDFEVCIYDKLSVGERAQIKIVPEFIKKLGYDDVFYFFKTERYNILKELECGRALSDLFPKGQYFISELLRLSGVTACNFSKNSIKNNNFNKKYTDKISASKQKIVDDNWKYITTKGLNLGFKKIANILKIGDYTLKFLIKKKDFNIFNKIKRNSKCRANAKMRENPENIEKLKIRLRKALLNRPSKASKPQIKLFEELKNYYPHIILEAPLLDRMRVDMLIDTTVIEFDGSGHNMMGRNNRQKDYARDKLLKAKGYSIIRVKSPKDKLPDIKNLINTIEGMRPSKFKEIHCG